MVSQASTVVPGFDRDSDLEYGSFTEVGSHSVKSRRGHSRRDAGDAVHTPPLAVSAAAPARFGAPKDVVGVVCVLQGGGFAFLGFLAPSHPAP